MRENLTTSLGLALRERRRSRHMTQDMLAARLGRSASRISELEKGLVEGKAAKDRLSLLAEICDALDLVPLLVPRERIAAVRSLLDETSPSPAAPASRLFDELFVDLGDEVDEGAPDADRDR